MANEEHASFHDSLLNDWEDFCCDERGARFVLRFVCDERGVTNEDASFYDSLLNDWDDIFVCASFYNSNDEQPASFYDSLLNDWEDFCL